jgi:hypothetical protein
MKKERVIDVNVTVNVDAIRAAASNAAKVKDVALEVPVIDPRDLSCDDQIFGIVLKPVNDNAKKSNPDTAVYCAVVPTIVETLSTRAKQGFITVNGTIDIAREGGKVNRLEECFFSNQADAKAVCRVITEVELERALEAIQEKQKDADFLQQQLNDDRF